MKDPIKSYKIKMYTVFGNKYFKYDYSEIAAGMTETLKFPTPKFNNGRIEFIKIFCNSTSYDVVIDADKNLANGTVNRSTVLYYTNENKFVSDSNIGAYTNKEEAPDNNELYVTIINNDSISTGVISVEISVIDIDS